MGYKKDLQNSTSLYLKVIPSIMEALLLLLPLINFFNIFYIRPDSYLTDIMQDPYSTRLSVTSDFIIFYIIFIISNYTLLYSRGLFVTSGSYITCLTASCLALYRFNELFSIKIFFLAILVISTALRFDSIKSIILITSSCIVFTVSLFYPSILGYVDSSSISQVKAIHVITYIIIISCISLFVIFYRKTVLQLKESMAINRHLNHSITQLTEFNQKLQTYAKNRGGEAAQSERLRITRDLHDSCGYTFVNIICLMEACCSAKEMPWSRVKETFETVRTLAKHGLEETRKTLRTIREIQDPIDTGLESLSEIKKIFQSVTGINVILDKGNIKNDYGPSVNKVLIRAMQEGLTNSVRHGMATEVIVDFRDDVDYLYMTIKDNGIGSRQVVKGIGLAGMEERLKSLGGELKTYSGLEGGFKLEIKIPVIKSMMEEYEKTKINAG